MNKEDRGSESSAVELRQRLVQLKVVNKLLAGLGTSLRPIDVMKEIVAALCALYPDLTAGVVVAGMAPTTARRVVMIYSLGPVSEVVKKQVAETLREGVRSISGFREVEIFKNWQVGEFDFELLSGDPDETMVPAASVIAVPFIVPGVMISLIGLATTRRQAFDDNTLASIYAVLGTAAETVEQLRRMLDREEAQLQEIERLRRDFMNIAAHDLRTPITAIKGFVQMIRQGELGEAPQGEIGAALADIETGTDRMIALVNDFLTISRFEQGTIALNLKTVDVGGLLKELVRQLKVTVERPDVVLRADVSAKLPIVRADERKIAQVVTNLVDNALKHTDSGEVTISARPYLKKYVEIVVADTGTGIAPEDIPHIFDRYYRGEKGAVAAGRGGGLGLGLYIVKMIIEKHGGRVWADSTVGKGANFHFTLPST